MYEERGPTIGRVGGRTPGGERRVVIVVACCRLCYTSRRMMICGKIQLHLITSFSTTLLNCYVCAAPTRKPKSQQEGIGPPGAGWAASLLPLRASLSNLHHVIIDFTYFFRKLTTSLELHALAKLEKEVTRQGFGCTT